MSRIIFFKSLWVVLIFGCRNQVVAQVPNLIVNTRPPSYLADWNKATAGQLMITGKAGESFRIETKLSDASGNVFAFSNLATATVQTLSSASLVMNLDRVLQLENMTFTANQRNLSSTGKLPPGQYQLCVQLYYAVDNVPLSDPICRFFTQTNYQLPYLLWPNDKVWLDAHQAQSMIAFRWGSLVPRSQSAVTYQLEVYEVLEGQQPMQAMRANQPILLTQLNNTTQYFWRPNLPFNDTSGRVFVWTIQTLDEKGMPIESADANTMGRSEPRIFGVQKSLLASDSTEYVFDSRCNCDRAVKR